MKTNSYGICEDRPSAWLKQETERRALSHCQCSVRERTLLQSRCSGSASDDKRTDDKCTDDKRTDNKCTDDKRTDKRGGKKRGGEKKEKGTAHQMMCPSQAL